MSTGGKWNKIAPTSFLLLPNSSISLIESGTVGFRLQSRSMRFSGRYRHRWQKRGGPDEKEEGLALGAHNNGVAYGDRIGDDVVADIADTLLQPQFYGTRNQGNLSAVARAGGSRGQVGNG